MIVEIKGGAFGCCAGEGEVCGKVRRTIAEDRTKLKTKNQKTKKPKMIYGPTAQASKPPNL